MTLFPDLGTAPAPRIVPRASFWQGAEGAWEPRRGWRLKFYLILLPPRRLPCLNTPLTRTCQNIPESTGLAASRGSFYATSPLISQAPLHRESF